MSELEETQNVKVDLFEDKIKAEEKKEAETVPLMDFSKTEDYPDDFEEKSKKIKKHYLDQIVGKLSEFLFGIFCIIMTVHTGPVGGVLFICALFFFLPDGFIKLIVYIHRYLHYKDYVNAHDYHVDNTYLKIVMQSFRKFPLVKQDKKD